MGRLVGLEVEGGALRWVTAELVEEIEPVDDTETITRVRMASGEIIMSITPFADVQARIDPEGMDMALADRAHQKAECRSACESLRIVPFADREHFTSDRERALLLAESDHLNGRDARVSLPVIRTPLTSRIKEWFSAEQRKAIRWIFGTDLSLLFAILFGAAEACL
jgi:hypothetical protein